MKKGIFRCMDFDTNHPKLIIAAVACDRNGLTIEAAAFSVRLSAFLFGAPRQCIKRWRFSLHGPGGLEHFQKQVAARKSYGTRRYHGEAILIFSVRTNTAGDIRLRVKIKYFKHTVFILAAVDAYKPFYF